MSQPGEREPMTEAGHSRIGTEVRRARKSRGWSTRELARRIGASQPYVSKLENGHIFPSIRTLALVAEALDVPAAQLLPVQPRSERIPSGQGMVARTAGEAPSRTLAIGEGRDLEVYRIELGAGEAEPRMHMHEGEEYVYVLSGRLELRREGAPSLSRSSGESVWLSGDTPHRLAGAVDGGGVALVFCARRALSAGRAHE